MSAQPAAAVAPMTAEQLMDLPDDGRRRELVDGELRELAPAGFGHGRVALRVGARLDELVHQERLCVLVASETGFVLLCDTEKVFYPHTSIVDAYR